MKEKLFVIRKFIMARSATHAIRKDRTTPVDDCYVDDDWKKGNAERLVDAIGFHLPPTSDEFSTDGKNASPKR